MNYGPYDMIMTYFSTPDRPVNFDEFCVFWFSLTESERYHCLVEADLFEWHPTGIRN